MKHPSVASPESEEDDVSECTMSCFDYGALRQAMMFSKVRRSRLRLLLVSIPVLLSFLMLFLWSFYLLSNPQPLLQFEVQLANCMNTTLEKSQTWIGDLEKALKTAERKMSELEQINHDQPDNIKYAHDPFSTEELVAKVKEATELQIESKLEVMAEIMIGKMNEAFFKHHTNASRISDFEKASQVIQPKMVAEKEEYGEAGAKRKGEMDSHFELLIELVRNVSQVEENCNGALNELEEQGASMMRLGCVILVITVSVFVAHKVIGIITKNAESTSELKQTKLSLHEVLKTISNLETKMERSKLFEEMTEKLLQELQAKEAGIQMAEMKGAMKTQGEEMTRVREDNDAALESKLCVIAKVKGLREKLEMQANLLVQVQKENEKAIKEVAQKKEETELTLQEALQKISNLEKEVEHIKLIWKSSGTKLVSHSSTSLFDDVLNCAPLKSGTFEWKIQVHTDDSYCLYLGVIGSSLKLPLDDYIGHTKKTWGYQSDSGDAYYWNDRRKDIENLPEYTDGSVVHFVLDLTNEGTLCVSVDGSLLVQLFSNMKSLIDHDEGFLPATSMLCENKIELLEFKCR